MDAVSIKRDNLFKIAYSVWQQMFINNHSSCNNDYSCFCDLLQLCISVAQDFQSFFFFL